MPDVTPYPLLFEPFARGRLRLRNRVVHASMTTRMAVGMRASERLIQYYANRAAGGAALIVTESLSVARNQKLAHKVRVWNDEGNDDLQRWAEAVNRHDCRLLGQIQDPGRGRHEKGRTPDAIGASSLPDDLSWTVPRALSTVEIRGMIADFAESAARLERCGFAGVELSCGHGHLFHQFMSRLSNERDDEYGGDFSGRLKIVRDAVVAVRAACSSNFLLGLKLPGDDGVPGSIDAREAALIAESLVDPATVDYVAFTWGSHANSLGMHIPDLTGPRAPFVPLTRALRAHCRGVPVMALGLITDPAEAQGILQRKDADLVALGRTLVTDPAWPLKARAGREAQIRYCVSCNTCWGTIVENKPLACDNNPRLAQLDEVDFWPVRAPQLRRVVVVGGGIAGMEAAWVAAARGHRVILLGSGAEPGGATRLHALLPGGEHLSSIYDYQTLAARRAGVELRFGVPAAVDEVSALEPDVVLLATGSELTWPRGWPAELRESGAVPDLRAAVAQMSGTRAAIGGRAVIFDMDGTEGTYAAAEFFQTRFDEVVVITPRERIAQDVPLVTQLRIWRRFNQQRIRILPFSEIDPRSDWENGSVSVRNIYNADLTAIDEVALVTYATPRRPRLGLLRPLQERGVRTQLIGDCLSPRSVLAATADGHSAGCDV
jgi:2,4-dienoyl-CoA reductase-like NADH-dependent reductase (Old Yellow Enzyme family)